jgi:hypothetical protein
VLSVTLFASCELNGSRARPAHSAEFSENSPTYKEALKSKKVRKQNADRRHPPSIVGKHSWTCLFAPTIGEQWPTWKDCFLRPAAIAASRTLWLASGWRCRGRRLSRGRRSLGRQCVRPRNWAKSLAMGLGVPCRFQIPPWKPDSFRLADDAELGGLDTAEYCWSLKLGHDGIKSSPVKESTVEHNSANEMQVVNVVQRVGVEHHKVCQFAFLD